MINIHRVHFETHEGLRVAPAPQPPRKARPTRRDALEAVRAFSKCGRAFSLREVREGRPELNMSLLFEVAHGITYTGEIRRLAKGLYIASDCQEPTEQDVQAMTSKAETASLRCDPLLDHIATPRHTAELVQEMGVVRGTVIHKLERLEAEGLACRRTINGGVYIGRTKADLDRKEAELLREPHPIFRRILELLPERGAVMRSRLLGQSNVGPVSGGRQLDRLEELGLVDVFSFSDVQYITLTDAGRQHAFRMEGLESRMPTTGWNGEKSIRRLGILMVVDTLGTPQINDIRAAVKSLPACFHAADPAQIVKSMISEGLLIETSPSPDLILGKRQVELDPRALETVQRLRQIMRYPESGQLRSVVEASRQRKRGARAPGPKMPSASRPGGPKNS